MVRVLEMDIYEKMKNRWPSAVVSQTKVEQFSGGLINPRTLMNLNVQGLGPGGKFRMGRKIFYDIDALLTWMKDRVEHPSENQGGCHE